MADNHHFSGHNPQDWKNEAYHRIFLVLNKKLLMHTGNHYTVKSFSVFYGLSHKGVSERFVSGQFPLTNLSFFPIY